MKVLSGVVALAAVAVLMAPASRAGAQAAFSDKLCPEATQYVVAVSTLTQKDLPQKQYDALHAAANAYDNCGKRHLASAEIEPGVHYAYTRQASFGVAEARALLALNRTADAKRALENSKRLAQDVFDWKQSYNQSGSSIASSGSDNRPSVYRDLAKEVLAAANDMLAKLAAPAAAATPVPSPHA
jgi:hypothetical protein